MKLPRRRLTGARSIVADRADPEGLASNVLEYLTALRARNYAEETVVHQQTYLSYFLEWAAERALVRPADVTRAVLERFRLTLYRKRKSDGHPLGFATQAHYLVSLRGFFRWLAREHRILTNPTADLDLPRQGTRLPRQVLTAGEVERILGLPDVATPLGIRDRAILEVLYSTGIRRTELVNLAVYDLDVERGTLMVREGKWKKDRMVPIGERATLWVLKYLEEVRPELVMPPDYGAIFLTREGEALRSKGLSRLVSQYVAASGKGGACHVFRHAMATLMVENGADIRHVQEILGHADLGTTQVYTQVSIRKLKEVHAATHPASARPSPTERVTPIEEGADGLATLFEREDLEEEGGE